MKKTTEKILDKLIENVYDLALELDEDEKKEVAESDKMETLDYYLQKIRDASKSCGDSSPATGVILFKGAFPGCKHIWSEGWGFRVCNVCGQHEEVEE